MLPILVMLLSLPTLNTAAERSHITFSMASSLPTHVHLATMTVMSSACS
jgi:hypothetical protein